MVRRVFYSFHYKPDSWRVSQVRNMGVVEGNRPATDNEWETVKNGKDPAIEKWIDEQMTGKSGVAVLIGSKTANRKWINYEIDKAWNEGRGVFGIYVHNLKDSNGNQCIQGGNPFYYVKPDGATRLSSIVKVYDPPYKTSENAYDYIKQHFAEWMEESISIRSKY